MNGLIPVAKRSKTRVCGHSLAGITGSNSTGSMFVCLLWMLFIPCDELTTRLEKSFPLWSVTVCGLETSRVRGLCPALGCCATEKKMKWPKSKIIWAWTDQIKIFVSHLSLKILSTVIVTKNCQRPNVNISHGAKYKEVLFIYVSHKSKLTKMDTSS